MQNYKKRRRKLGENLSDLGFGDKFLVQHKSKIIERKTIKLDFIKTEKQFFSFKTQFRE